MKKVALLMIAVGAMLFVTCEKKRPGKPRVLVFSKFAGFHHLSIPAGVAAIQKLGMENGFEVDTTRNAEFFQEDSLRQYAAVIFLNTTGNVLDYRQEAAFERYIQAGGGFVGVHSATDTEYDWGWYGRLVGAYFSGHPRPQQARFIIKDTQFPATSFFKDSVWLRTDELYSYKRINPDLHILITIDEASYEGGTNGAFHPMSWYHEYDGGRAFYTGLGHTDESYSEELYLKHLLGGIQYAIGDNQELNYGKATTQFPPSEDRFTKVALSQGEFFEPTEMTVLPNLDILIVQRRGEVMLYKHETQKVKQVGYLPVYSKAKVSNVNVEEGLLGLAKDPHFADNNRVYMYYSPVDTSVNRLSRFIFKNDTLDLSTEKVILEVKSQREICCHTGGSIAFGPDGLLYFSAGDNSTPFDESGQKYVNSGFGPLNDEPGHQQYDARRSSSNTNDLRGKISRIKVNDDGSYDIPDGNLFPKGTEKTRPEIYVMGNRNPYRISVDQKNSNLYWGEVGPDASRDSLDTRGPRGYDEFNQARKAGYFGWPLFVGNNYPYHQYDYTTGKSGPQFDPSRPINDSRNNTGLRELPPVSPAFIWYPYAPSPDFPQVGTGGRNAMAGPVYYTDLYPSETRLPDYYNGKLIIYEWVRGWIKAVTMLPSGDFDKMEPFFPAIKVNSLIDMEVGPDGKLYLLEYGTGWFTRNKDSGLSRIDYNSGNLPPKLTELKVDKTSGVLPMTIKASIEATDAENDKVTYRWNMGDGPPKETASPEMEYTYKEAGDYAISVEAVDAKGATSQSSTVSIYAGNEVPKVSIEITGGNKSFYLPGTPLKYSVHVTDNDAVGVDPANLFVSADYAQGYDKAGASPGHQQGQSAISGKSLTQSLDCKACHKENEPSVGPSYLQVAKKYKGDANANAYLIKKITNGGSGVWGEVAMPAHATIATGDVEQIVTWIISLANEATAKKSLTPKGTIVPPETQKPNTVLVISASYTDKGSNYSKPLTGSTQTIVPGNTLAVTGYEEVSGFSHMAYAGVQVLLLPAKGGWFATAPIDLTGVHSLDVSAGWQSATDGFDVDVRLDSHDGKSIGKGSMPKPKKDQRTGFAHVPLRSPEGNELHRLFIVYKPKGDAVEGAVGSLRFNGK